MSAFDQDLSMLCLYLGKCPLHWKPRHKRGVIQGERNWGCPGKQFSKYGLWNPRYSLKGDCEVKRSSMQDYNVAKNKKSIDNGFKFHITSNL